MNYGSKHLRGFLFLCAFPLYSVVANAQEANCYATPSPAAPPPTPIEVTVNSTCYVEIMWESIGSRFAIKPRSILNASPQITPLPDANRLPPAIDSSDVNSSNYNDYSAHVVQGVYQDNMWLSPFSRADDFAMPVIFLFGATHWGGACLMSGVGLSRSSNDSGRDPDKESKTAIGHLSQAILTRGGACYDGLRAIGSFYVGSSGRYYAEDLYESNEGQTPSPTPTATPTGSPSPFWIILAFPLALVPGAVNLGLDCAIDLHRLPLHQKPRFPGTIAEFRSCAYFLSH